MVKGFSARLRRLITGAALCVGCALVVGTPKPAEAWWGPGWGWHAGWGWRGGFAVGLPPVVVGAPVYPAPYGYAYPYAPADAYGRPYWHWVPGHVAPNGVFVAGHWEH